MQGTGWESVRPAELVEVSSTESCSRRIIQRGVRQLVTTTHFSPHARSHSRSVLKQSFMRFLILRVNVYVSLQIQVFCSSTTSIDEPLTSTGLSVECIVRHISSATVIIVGWRELAFSTCQVTLLSGARNHLYVVQFLIAVVSKLTEILTT